MERVTFALTGMSCGHCVATVEKALSGVEGVTVEQVGINTATVELDPRVTSASLVAAVLDAAGYPVQTSAAI